LETKMWNHGLQFAPTGSIYKHYIHPHISDTMDRGVFPTELHSSIFCCHPNDICKSHFLRYWIRTYYAISCFRFTVLRLAATAPFAIGCGHRQYFDCLIQARLSFESYIPTNVPYLPLLYFDINIIRCAAPHFIKVHTALLFHLHFESLMTAPSSVYLSDRHVISFPHFAYFVTAIILRCIWDYGHTTSNVLLNRKQKSWQVSHRFTDMDKADIIRRPTLRRVYYEGAEDIKDRRQAE